MEKNRAQTDRSLRTERTDTDKAVLDMKVAAQLADKVVDLARQTADAVLITARDRADQAAAPSTAVERAVIDNDRARADDALESERRTADDRLRLEREDGSHALAALLPLEREHTDRDLLTERGRSDDALAERDNFLAIVSHDMRNLLGGIALSSASLTMRASETDEGKQIVKTGMRIQLYAARMNKLIGDLQDVASIEAGQLATAIVPGDPLALIVETIETFRNAAVDKGIVLEFEVAGVLPRAAFDYGRMLQVFANVIANALKFTSPGGKICIRAESAGGEVHFAVSDTGIGIPANMLDAVFRRFWQGAKDDRRGTGLGLYISKSMVEAHGGRIWVESKVGQGSVFHFTLPVVAHA
jgi:signal transduction histidine kinase